ncbi:MAG: Holliday junction resolvase Hjc [Nanobdellota archaeon]
MSAKRRGITAERSLVHSFWESGWAAVRVAGSGSSQFPSPDILAGNKGRRLAIECKITTESKKYIPLEDIRHLEYFAKVFGAEVWIAVKFFRKPWAFINVEDMVVTAKSVVITPSVVDTKGLSFQELVD